MTIRSVLIQAIESSGFSVSGPTDSRAAENGEPAWVCNARAALAEDITEKLLKQIIHAFDSASNYEDLDDLIRDPVLRAKELLA